MGPPKGSPTRRSRPHSGVCRPSRPADSIHEPRNQPLFGCRPLLGGAGRSRRFSQISALHLGNDFAISVEDVHRHHDRLLRQLLGRILTGESSQHVLQRLDLLDIGLDVGQLHEIINRQRQWQLVDVAMRCQKPYGTVLDEMLHVHLRGDGLKRLVLILLSPGFEIGGGGHHVLGHFFLLSNDCKNSFTPLDEEEESQHMRRKEERNTCWEESMSVGDRLRLGIISLMNGGMRTGRNSRSHEGLQILAVAGIAGVILNPFDGPSVTGVFAGSLLPLLVAGHIHDTQTAAVRAVFENGLLVAEPLAILDHIGHVIDAIGVRRSDGHLARDVVILGHGELFGQRSLAINAVAGLVEFDRIVGVAAGLRCAVLGDKADETAVAENLVQAGLHVGHGRRDEIGGQLLGRVIGCETVGACNHDLRGAKVIAR
nr:MAG TPA: hypothetical protein [Caudoviricetes sp.]